MRAALHERTLRMHAALLCIHALAHCSPAAASGGHGPASSTSSASAAAGRARGGRLAAPPAVLPATLRDFGFLNSGTTTSAERLRAVEQCTLADVEGTHGFKTGHAWQYLYTEAGQPPPLCPSPEHARAARPRRVANATSEASEARGSALSSGAALS